MAYTLLDAVNLSLKRVRVIQGDAGELTSLKDSARQADIDIMVQAWNEIISDLYNTARQLPSDTKEGTITLVAGTREYDKASDVDIVSSNIMVDQTNGQYLYAYPGGYEAMFVEQTQPANYTGLPIYWTINPTNAKFRLDRSPTATEAGKIYTYLYRKRLYMDLATATFPFADSVVNDLIQGVKEVWNRESKEKFDMAAYQTRIARAAVAISQVESREKY